MKRNRTNHNGTFMCNRAPAFNDPRARDYAKAIERLEAHHTQDYFVSVRGKRSEFNTWNPYDITLVRARV